MNEWDVVGETPIQQQPKLAAPVAPAIASGGWDVAEERSLEPRLSRAELDAQDETVFGAPPRAATMLPAGESPDRSWGELVNDILLQGSTGAAEGLTWLADVPRRAINTLTANIGRPPDMVVDQAMQAGGPAAEMAKMLAGVREALRIEKPEAQAAWEVETEKRVAAAREGTQDGTQAAVIDGAEYPLAPLSDKAVYQQSQLQGAEGVGETVRAILSNPSMILTEGAKMAGQMAPALPAAIAGAVPGLATLGSQAASGNTQQIEQQINDVATPATPEDAALLQRLAPAIAEARTRVPQLAEADDPTVLKYLADTRATEAFLPSAVINSLLGRLIPGGTAIERAVGVPVASTLSKSRVGNAAMGGIGELITEALQGGADQALQNVATEAPVMDDVMKQAAIEGLLAAGPGAAAGATTPVAAGRPQPQPASTLASLPADRVSAAPDSAPPAPPVDLAPRQPAAAAVPEGVTLDQARETYRAAQTDEERAQAAAVIGELQARERPQEADLPEMPERAAPTPRVQEAVAASLGEANRDVFVHAAPDQVPGEVAQRIGLRQGEKVEGFYDPQTGAVHVIESDLDTSRMAAEDRAVWVAHHERSGHAGLRGLALEAAGGQRSGRAAQFTAMMDRARQNPTVATIADKIATEYTQLAEEAKARGEEGPAALTPQRYADEALAEMTAAVRTNNFAEIEKRYGVQIPEAQRSTIRGYIQRLVQSIKKMLGRGDAFSDADVYQLIEDSWRYVKSGRSTTGREARQDRAPIASRSELADLAIEDEGFENNASGESSASVEAIRRQRDERDQGRVRMLIDRDGTIRPLIGVDAVDTFARPGQIIVQRNVGRDEWTILSQGNDVSSDLAAGRVNAARPRLTDAMRDELVASRATISADQSRERGDVEKERKDRREATRNDGQREKPAPGSETSEADRQDDRRAIRARLDSERGEASVIEGEEDIPFSRRQTVNPYGADAGTDLEGLPSRVRVGDRVVEFHGYEPAQTIAAKYAKRNGNTLPKQYVQVDVPRAKRIANAYGAMKHDPQNPQVQRAYKAMIDETAQQYRDMLKTGLKVEFIVGDDPYAASPRLAIMDVVENNHLWVYPTDRGFGSGDMDVSSNPLLAETDFEISGRKALANDIFRAVHDYFGHIANGIGFRADGEENAWREHSAMYSPIARRAMTTETRGQNSWVNYGPSGEANQTATAAETVYADQKTGLLPEWVSEEGRTDEPIASRGFSAKPSQPDAVSVDAYHYSREEGLDELDTRKAGSGSAGRERRRFGTGTFGRRGGTAARMGFYVREPGAPVPRAESVVQGRNVYRVQLDNLYDLDADPRSLVAGNIDETEEAISQAGYDGFVTSEQPGIKTPVAVVFDIARPIPVKEVDQVIASRPQTNTPAFKRWFGESKVVDDDGNPLVVYHATNATFDAFSPQPGADIGFHFGTIDQATERLVRNRPWFTEDQDGVRRHRATGQVLEGEQFLPVYLSIKNPLTVTDPGYFSAYDEDFVFDLRGSGIDVTPGDSNESVISAIEAAGYDGLVYENEGEGEGVSYVAFHPWQIKSATGNRGTFNEADPSIIASRVTPQQKQAERQSLLGHLASQGYPQSPQSVPPPAGGFWSPLKDAADSTRIKLQDRMLPLLRAQERVSKKSAPGVTSIGLADTMNAYRMETLMHGAVRDLQEGAEQKYVLPIQRRLKNTGMSVQTFEGWLLARAAEEVNTEVAKIKGAMQDGAAGITTAEARAVLAGTGPNPYTNKPMTPKELQQAAAMAPLIDDMRDAILRNMVDAGQITPKLAAQLKAKYKHYIPMRGSKADEWMQSVTGTGKGLGQTKANIKRRLGRGVGNLPENILGEMAGDMQRSNIAKAKAKVNQSFLRFLLANPMPDLATIEPVDLEWKYSEATGEAYLGVKAGTDDLQRSIIVMHDGNPVRIRFEDEQIRDAVMNMGVDDYQAFVKIVGAINRWRSKVLTQYNPAFTPVNILRDFLFGTTAIATEKGVGTALRTIARYNQAAFAIAQDNLHRPGNSSVPDAQKTTADWAREASEMGMRTGLTQVDDVIDLQRQMSIGATTLMQLAKEGRSLRLAQQSIARAGKPILDAISNVNDAYENALRLSVYIDLRKKGETKERAAEYAKNVTINFNRRGKLGPLLNSLYLFYNASMQGTHAVLRVMRNPKVQMFLAGMAGLQAYMAASMMSDDDEDGVTTWDMVPDYVKRTSLVIPLQSLTGDQKDYFALPMPFGFNVFTYSGGRMAQWHMQGQRETDPSFIGDVVKSMTEAFMPIPVADGYGSLFGDQVGFGMQLAANKDDLGRPIANEDQYAEYDSPRALEGRPDTPRFYHATAQLLAKLGGGNLERRVPPIGYLDVAPEQIEAVVNYMGGGLSSLTNKGFRWWEQMDAGNLERGMDEVAATPIMSRLVGSGNEGRAIADRYYAERGELARKRDVIDDRIRKGEDPDVVLEEESKDPTLRELAPARYQRDTDTAVEGQVKRTETGAVQMSAGPGSVSRAFKTSEKAIKAVNKAIRGLRDPELTNAQAADIVSAYDVAPADIGLPEGYTADVEAPNRVRQRAIKLLQAHREVAQKDALKAVERTREEAARE